MMNFTTPVPVSKSSHQIDYSSEVLLLGSCFSEHMGNKLDYYKFQILQNPFGILFHPWAIENLITKAINGEKYIPSDVFENQGLWHSFDAHSRLSDLNQNALLNTLNTALSDTQKKLATASHIIITLGTSWIYRFITSDTFVANCHKIPQKNFLKELFSTVKVQESLEAINALIRSVNENTQIIYTVSPVRHLKDGFIENQRSKSHLIAAIHDLVDPRKRVNYFPAYEIMTDELRDYRFYDTDMIHPNATAVQYIWDKFKFNWINEKVYSLMDKVGKVQKGMMHRPFNPDAAAHQNFLMQLEILKKEIKEEYPHIRF